MQLITDPTNVAPDNFATNTAKTARRQSVRNESRCQYINYLRRDVCLCLF